MQSYPLRNFISNKKNYREKEPVKMKIIIEKLPQVKESKIWEVLEFLQQEELVIVNEEGFIKPV